MNNNKQEPKQCYHLIGEEALNDDGCCIGCGIAAEHLDKTNYCENDRSQPCVMLGNILPDVIDRFRSDTKITYAEVIGMLEIVKQDIYMELREEGNEKE